MDTRAELARAWIDRTNMDIDACRRRHFDLRDRLAAAPTLANLAALSTNNQLLILEWLLLDASLERAEGRWDRSRAQIAAIEAFVQEHGVPVPYALHCQKALMHFNDGDALLALDAFLAALSVARSAFEEVVALSNVLLCLENLGHPLQPHLAALETALQSVPEDPDFEEARRSYEALRARQNFRAGDLSAALAIPPGPPLGQPFYYQLWLAELPYHRAFGTLPPERRSALLTAHPLTHQKAYRTRTLLGLLVESDQAAKITELADRLYLWTWRWLADPQAFPIARVLATLQRADWEAIAPRLTAEDHAMIRNAVRWLGLFDAASEPRLERFLRALRPAHPAPLPLLDWEAEMIAYFRARREGEKMRHPRPPAGMRDSYLIPANESGPLAGLQAELARLGKVPAPKRGLLVDFARERLVPAGGRALISAPLCQTLQLLRGQQSVPLAELAATCFGIRAFDPAVHGPRVANSLSRLRRLCPRGLQIAIRGERVHAIGDWSGVVFDEGSPRAQTLQAEPVWKSWPPRAAIKVAPARNQKHVGKPQLLKGLSPGTAIRREELERLTGKSRSSTNRLIAQWLKTGVLKKSGRARGTRYFLRDTK